MDSQFDAIGYMQQLRAAGASHSEAEVHARAILQLVEDCTAPRVDLAPPDRKLNAGLDDIERRIASKLDEFAAGTKARETDLKTEISKLRAENADMREDLKYDRWTTYIILAIVFTLFLKLVPS
jgi:hypothetical protein